jgi:hypothetical protein
MKCTSCGSEQTRKFSVVFEEGTTTGRSESLTGNEVEHFSQTPLAKKCSPPEAPKVGGFLTLIGAFVSLVVALKVGNFFGGFSYGVAGFVASMFVLFLVWRAVIGNHNSAQYAIRLAEWRKSWVCLKCGHTYCAEERA